MPDGNNAPGKPKDGGPISAVIELIRLVWITNPRLALPLTVLAVLVLLTTIFSLGWQKDLNGAFASMAFFLLLLGAFAFLIRITGRPEQVIAAHGLAGPPTTSQRWIIWALLASLGVGSLLFGTTVVALTSPEIAQGVMSAGLKSLRTPSCLLRPFSNCTEVLNEIAPIEQKPVPAAAAEPQPVAPTAVARDKFTIYIQYENLPRDWIKTLAKNLHDAGWKVPSYTAGGERIPAAQGLVEVRYGNADDKAAAEQLAAEISTQKVTTEPLKTKLLPIITKGVLEVWISG